MPFWLAPSSVLSFARHQRCSYYCTSFLTRSRTRQQANFGSTPSSSSSPPLETIGSNNNRGASSVDSSPDPKHHINNPTLDWKGASQSTSGFCTHVLIPPDQAPCSLVKRVQSVLDEKRQQLEPEQPVTELEALALLELGAVWFLPASAPRDPSQGAKPVRLTHYCPPSPNGANNGKQLLSAMMLQPGDYLRIHHYPRRFPAVYQYDWSRRRRMNAVVDSKDDDDTMLPSVVVDWDDKQGWIVIDKPPMVPVHMTVDNFQENAAYCIQQALAREQNSNELLAEQDVSSSDDLPYVTTPQRLDQNTSGLLVVSTSKLFANYYAGLLRTKTEKRIEKPDQGTQLDGIHKLYRCLVCLVAPDKEQRDDAASWSVGQAARVLQGYAKTGELVRHYLEPSIRAPKRFFLQVPPSDNPTFTTNTTDDSSISSWPECLLRIRNASGVYAMIGNAPAHQLASTLWSYPTEAIPPNCQAVMELQVELLTGRTHQVRGQLATMGFPLVGDVQYGGAIPSKANATSSGLINLQQRLALQCCELEFVDPDVIVSDNGTEYMRRSNRWNRFRLEQAWWSPHLRIYDEQMGQVPLKDATTLVSDSGLVDSSPEPTTTLVSDIGLVEDCPIPTTTTTTKIARPELLPVRVSLSPGKHKYVLVRATHPGDDEVQWFVKSAAPQECGGPYHGNVAQDLREWIEAAGYKPHVTGGGRIDYRPDEKHAVVYGFSYGFGRGDHAKAASIIRAWSKGIIDATYDNTEGLY